MVGQALFYGREQSTLWQDIVASFITSLFGFVPQLLVREIFIKSRPRKTDSTKRRRSSKIWTKTSAVNMEKYQEVSVIRQELYKNMYKCPSYFREIAWCILLVTAMAACFVAILYGLSFDLEVVGTVNEDNRNVQLYGSDCWTTSLQLRIEDALSKTYFDEAYAQRIELNESSYAGSDSDSWLLSLGQSLLLSLILWQPLTYVSLSNSLSDFKDVFQNACLETFH